MENLDILCCGELTIDEISTVEKITDSQASGKLKSTNRFYGGRAGNFAVYSSLFGARVGLVAAAAQDQEGLEYKKYLASKGIDLSNLFENEKAKTNKCFIFNDEEKTRIFFYGGALREERDNYLRHASGVANKVDGKAVYCTSPDQEMNMEILSGSKAETKIYAPSSNLYAHSKESILECLGNADMLFLNKAESDFLEAQLEKGPAEIIREFGLGLMVKTMGASGSQVITDKETIDIRPSRPARVLDASGAGDAFAGSFVANYLKTKDPAYSGKIASAVASFVVEEIGCQTNIPTVEKVMQRANAPAV